MQHAIDICPVGELADPRAIMRLAGAAEASGWQGLSIWDTLGLALDSTAADPFVALTAVAGVTRHLRLITSVVALARRRPQLVVQAAGTLDLASGGRLVLGVGAGEDEPDFSAFGESHDRTARVARMAEGLDIVDAGLRGEVVDHDGPALRAQGFRLGPTPAQQPRPPIWLGALRPGGIRRAARWDGWIAIGLGDEDFMSMAMTPARLAELVAVALAERVILGLAEAPFDVAILGITGGTLDGVPVMTAAYASAGATWWLESLSPARGSLDELEAIVRSGPPA